MSEDNNKKIIDQIDKGIIKEATVQVTQEELNNLVEKFNDYSKLQAMKIMMEEYNTKKIPSEDLFIELEALIANHIDAFYYQITINGLEKQYEILREATIKVLDEIRKVTHPNMSDSEFKRRCSSIIIILNITIPPEYGFKKESWDKVLTRYIC